MKRIILCADDFAMNRSISDGIIDLIEQKRISATSCLTDSSLWLEYGKKISKYNNKIDIGLHFNLTEDFGYFNKPISYWIVHSMINKLPRKKIKEAFKRQIGKFIEVTGRYPDCIDGHHHIHILRGIRDIILDYLYKHNLSQRIYIRSIMPMYLTDARFKASVIKFLALGWEETIANDFNTNSSFAGIYRLRVQKDYAGLFDEWMRMASGGCLIMCHPGKNGDDHDKIKAVRVAEYNFLRSDRFQSVCLRNNVSISRFSHAEPSAVRSDLSRTLFRKGDLAH
jgi:predicted glycoside hydrolase/deacetylase ChbG (UPF0249 family)